jgi:hypothetical protein
VAFACRKGSAGGQGDSVKLKLGAARAPKALSRRNTFSKHLATREVIAVINPGPDYYILVYRLH